MDLQMETVNLGQYVKEATHPSLTIPPTGLYECERLPLAQVKYPRIDLSFFKHLTQHKGNIWLPLFAWFKVEGHKIGKCCFGWRTWGKRDRDVYFYFCDYPRITWMYIAQAIAQKISATYYYTRTGDNRIVYRFSQEYPDVINQMFTATFHGLIPQTTREKIEEARPLFDEIAIVSEEHQWKAEEIKVDPLIIGMIGESTFLIDHFDTTGAEDYIIAKFEK